MLMAQLFSAIGLTRATEKTYAMGAALATQSHGMEVNQLLADGRRLKEFTRAIVNDNEQLEQGPLNYPANITEFKEAHPHLYAHAFPDHEPVESKWSTAHRAIVHSRTVCRDTRRGVNKGEQMPHDLHVRHDRRALAGACQGFEGLPGFQFCGPSPRIGLPKHLAQPPMPMLGYASTAQSPPGALALPPLEATATVTPGPSALLPPAASELPTPP